MKVIRPSFWNKFQCIGSKCTDNCCIGWEIDIDPETTQKYQQVSGELGRRLKESIQVQDGEYSFRMNGERCPFLNQKNLCDLILELGEGSLCEICREHPRFYEWFGAWKEAGLGLCCEEAVRLLLAKAEPLTFETVWDDEEESFCVDSPWLPLLVEVREVILRNLQDRGRNLQERMQGILELAGQVQECMDREDEEGLEEIIASAGSGKELSKEDFGEKEKTDLQQWKREYEKLLDVFLEMEAMDENWPKRLAEIREKLPELYVNLEDFEESEKEWDYEWEHLAVYSIFRYFLKAIDDEDVISKVKLAEVACRMIRLLDLDCWVQKRELTQWDRICNIKAYSKELEYSTENLEKLMDAMWEAECEG